MTWTQESVEKMKALSLQGLSASKIGEQMGKTKNMVVGKMYRMKVKSGHIFVPQKRYKMRIRSSYFPLIGETRKCNVCDNEFDMRSRFDRFCSQRCRNGD